MHVRFRHGHQEQRGERPPLQLLHPGELFLEFRRFSSPSFPGQVHLLKKEVEGNIVILRNFSVTHGIYDAVFNIILFCTIFCFIILGIKITSLY